LRISKWRRFRQRAHELKPPNGPLLGKWSDPYTTNDTNIMSQTQASGQW
jgi:hypothetical protein